MTSPSADLSFWQRLGKTPLSDLLRGRGLTARLDWPKPAACEELPEPLQELVRAVVHRTRLWRRERVAIAAELTAHFADGLDAGRSVEELKEAFGEARMAAKLIRRATRRKRPLWWRGVRYLSMGLASLVGCYLLLAAYLVAGSPTIRTDYVALLNTDAAAVPESEAAWPIYREAMLAHDFKNMDTAPLRAEGEQGNRALAYPGEPAWPGAAAFVREREDLLAAIREAAARPRLGLQVGLAGDFSPEDLAALFEGDGLAQPAGAITEDAGDAKPDLVMDVLLPQLGHLRTMARLLTIDLRLAAHEGDAQRALADVDAMLGLARHAQETPTLISALVSMTIQNIACRELTWLLADHAAMLDDQQLALLAHRLAAAQVDVARSLKGERYFMYDLVQRIYTDDGHGNGRITDEGLRFLSTVLGAMDSLDDRGPGRSTVLEWSSMPVASVVLASRRDLLDTYDGLMDRLTAALAVPMHELPNTGIDAELAGWSLMQRTRYMAVATVMPALERVRHAKARARASRDGVLIGIALELYRRQHGDWPASLSELVPSYIPRLPVDPITGGEPKYRVVDGQPLVYSVGADLDDDGGAAPTGGGTTARREASARRGAMEWPGAQPAAWTAPDGDWILYPDQEEK